MCMEDIRIGRRSQGGYYKGTATQGNVEAIGANPHRTALYFSGPGTGGGTAVFLTFSPDNTMIDGQGVTTANFGPGQLLTIEDIGNIITKSWYVRANTGTPGYCVIEKSTLDDQRDFSGS